MDRLQTLTAFVAVADEGGFAPASRKLNVSPPSVTRAIAELETRLGARLFHRTTRNVRLTEAGSRYLTDCRRILVEIEEADRHAAGVHAAPRGLVSLTASVVFGRTMVTPLLLTLLDRYPDISISTLFVDRVVHMVDEGLDVAVRIADLPDSSLTAIRVGSVRRVLCASPSYLKQTCRPTTPSNLSDHRIVDFSAMTPGSEWRLEKAGKSYSVRPNARLRVNSADAAIAAVSAGYGITRVLSYMIHDQVESGDLELVLEDYEPQAVPVHVVHKETGRASARVRAVVDHLVAGLQGSQALQPVREGGTPTIQAYL